MPIYEYRCRACGHGFEALVLAGTTAACPECRSQDLEQQISLFAVSSESTRQSNLTSARRENAKTLRDKKIAEHEQERHHHH
jgi:putative FmdB family regulatory protein